MSETDKVYVNGIDGVTGQYLVEPFAPVEALHYFKEARPDPWTRRFFRRIVRILKGQYLGLPDGVDPANVTQAGWAVVYHEHEDPAVKEALAPLVEHRRQQIGREAIVKVLTYCEGEDRANWLKRHNVGIGSVEPARVPYYVLLAGSPERIPFDFGHLLDVEYAVGRLAFDAPEAYRAYADSLIRYETADMVANAREVVYWSPRHKYDPATQMSADLLVNKLAAGDPGPGIAEQRGFRTKKIWGDEATKAALLHVLAPGAARPPSLLFTASHGLGLPRGHERQLGDQGALLAQDWPGFAKIAPEHYVSARDVLAADARVHGLIALVFACYGAGTPSRDRFLHRPGEEPPVIADQAFVAALPKALLSYPGGGALACIGHVERAWGYSIRPGTVDEQIGPFKNALSRILRGQPVGHAMRDFDERYASLSAELNEKLEEIGFGGSFSDLSLASNWVERNDAEGYAVIGDPAARLRVDDLV